MIGSFSIAERPLGRSSSSLYGGVVERWVDLSVPSRRTERSARASETVSAVDRRRGHPGIRAKPEHPLLRGVPRAGARGSAAAGAQRRPVPARRLRPLRHRARSRTRRARSAASSSSTRSTATARAGWPARRRCRTRSTACSATSCARGGSTSSSSCTGRTARPSPRSSTRSSAASSTTRSSPEGALYRFNWIFPTEKLVKGAHRLRRQARRARASSAPTRTSTARTSTCGSPCELRDHPLFLIPRAERQKLLARGGRAGRGRTRLRALRLPARGRALPQVPADLRRAARRATTATTSRCCATCRSSASTSRAATRSARSPSSRR